MEVQYNLRHITHLTLVSYLKAAQAFNS